MDDLSLQSVEMWWRCGVAWWCEDRPARRERCMLGMSTSQTRRKERKGGGGKSYFVPVMRAVRVNGTTHATERGCPVLSRCCCASIFSARALLFLHDQS